MSLSQFLDAFGIGKFFYFPYFVSISRLVYKKHGNSNKSYTFAE